VAATTTGVGILRAGRDALELPSHAPCGVQTGNDLIEMFKADGHTNSWTETADNAGFMNYVQAWCRVMATF